MPLRRIFSILTCFSALSVTAHADNISYIDNGKIKVGINLDLGGSITYLSKSGSDLNLVNSADWGRQIQMSFYSGPNPFEPNGKKPRSDWAFLGWNPIQSGDCAGHRSQVLKSVNDGKSIYTKCVPMQWPLDDEPAEAAFESWITLKDNTVQVKCRMLNNRADKTQYNGRDQELPAIYTNAPWWKLMTYDGDKPFTSDKLTQIPAVMPWKRWQSRENWAALVDDSGWGLGVWAPGVNKMIGGFAGKPRVGGPKDSSAGYMAPIHEEIIDHNIDYTYNYVLVLGSIQQIRDYVYKQPRPDKSPKWVFAKDRQHWVYRNATDTGWPINKELNIQLNQNSPQIISPVFFAPAENNPFLYVMAAFRTRQKTARVLWESKESSGFDDSRSVSFKIIGDGTFRKYIVRLSSRQEYKGSITRLNLVPSQLGSSGQSVRIKSIGFVKP